MSRRYIKRHEIDALAVGCRYCGAASGVWCTLANDAWAVQLHTARYAVARNWTWTARHWMSSRDSHAEARMALHTILGGDQ